jgi:hypothetical protein
MDEQVKMLRKVDTRVTTMEEQTQTLKKVDTAIERINEKVKIVEMHLTKEDSWRKTFGQILNRVLICQREMGMPLEEIKEATVAERTEESESEDDEETNPGPPADSAAAPGMAATASQFVTEPVKSPDVTMTTATPNNSQDDIQNTSTLVASTIPVPAPVPPTMIAPSNSDPHTVDFQQSSALVTAPAHLAPPVNLPSNIPSNRRSPRIRDLSRPPTPAVESASKREAEEFAGGDPKRQKLGPS